MALPLSRSPRIVNDERGAAPLVAALVLGLVTVILALFMATVLLASTMASQASTCPKPPTAEGSGGSVAPPGGPAEPPSGAGSGQFTDFEWAKDFLSRLGVPDSPDNEKVIVAWERAEGGHFVNNAHFNPLNTTLNADGATSINSVGVKSYPDYETGMQATLTTIRANYYTDVITALQAGNNPQGVIDAVGASPWGTAKDLFQQIYDGMGSSSGTSGPAVGGGTTGKPKCPEGGPPAGAPWPGGTCPALGPNGETDRPPEEMTDVRGITVHKCIAAQLEAMMAAAEADGVTLSGSGYRPYERQVELRTQDCGSSEYAIYEAPSSSCSPPTAKPGFSNHEGGVAIDFNSGIPWLFDYANAFGFFNYQPEPWHWSTSGS
ncbi:MAG: D-alanyl-D-alanine carboxypeptidase family protein [Acidimicrobiales bacterium]